MTDSFPSTTSRSVMETILISSTTSDSITPQPLIHVHLHVISSNTFSMNTYPINPGFLVKLDDTNYLIWHEQLKHIITIYGLHSFIMGKLFQLLDFARKLSIIDHIIRGTQLRELFEENPEYQLWERHIAVKMWIYSSVTPTFLKHLIHKDTAYQHWLALEKSFNDDSEEILIDLRW